MKSVTEMTAELIVNSLFFPVSWKPICDFWAEFEDFWVESKKFAVLSLFCTHRAELHNRFNRPQLNPSSAYFRKTQTTAVRILNLMSPVVGRYRVSSVISEDALDLLAYNG